MADYIDREKLLGDLERFAPECRAAFLIIEKQEALDAVPVVHGRWVCLEPEIGYYGCSLCDHRILRAKCNYCPNCGAVMNLEVKDA